MIKSKSPISSIELCNFFINGFINGYINYHQITSNVQDVDMVENPEIKIATWKLGFETGRDADNGRLN